jgi:magnesium-transporting ATPase (P-type)
MTGSVTSGERARTDAPIWHALAVEDVLKRLEVDPESGLSHEEAGGRLERFGGNVLPEPPAPGPIVRFLKQFHNVLIYVLIVAAAFTALLDEWIDTGVILAVVLVNALIGFVQEGKAESALEGIRKLLSPEAVVVRGGQRRRIPAAEVVPGDIVLLESGDRVPADLRLLEVHNARTEEAVLTGESEPVSKGTDPAGEDALPGDRRGMAFSGTLVTSGRLRGVVVATGVKTEIGRIGEMVSQVQTLQTPLLRRIDTFGKWLSAAILLLAVGLFGFGALFRDFTGSELFLIAVSIAVAAIPEGLPAILTITLALGVQRMAYRKAVIRRLPAVDTLGSVTVICSDKTGTLTRGEMTAGRVVTDSEVWEVTGSGYLPEGDILREGEKVGPGSEVLLRRIGETVLLCNDAELEFSDEGEPVLQGDPTEGALVVLAIKAGLDAAAVHADHKRVDVLPFESENRFMATLNRSSKDGNVLHVKGAPEKLFEMCDRALGPGGEETFDRERWEDMVEATAGEGFRMLAVATGRGLDDVKSSLDIVKSSENEGDGRGLLLLGVVGLMDPPRPEVAEAVEACRSAGIRVKMITGDHASTASAIAARLGIGDGEGAVTGGDLDACSEEELEDVVQSHDVFARTSPEHKLRLVEALQRRGEVTAMTGDGVNDAPALRRADIGVAMGIKGSEASRSASDMVLADDNFDSIRRAVEEGRTVYDNLKKTILFILPTNGAESLLIMGAVIFALSEMPITPVQILWVNMITAVTLALALAFEPAEPGVMKRPPRHPDEPLLSPYLIWRIAFVAVLVTTAAQLLFFRSFDGGASPERARTVAVNVLVAGQLFYLFNARFIMEPAYGLKRLLSSRAALVAAGMLVVFQLAFTYAPWFQLWFGTESLALGEWVWVTVAGALVFILVEVEKAVVRRWRRPKKT